MKTLKLTLQKKWFDMIKDGVKKEEYRIIKEHWDQRLKTKQHGVSFFRQFDAVEFTNGYSSMSPQITVKFEGVEVGIGKIEWGAVEGEKYYVIKLGEEISLKNC